MPLKIPAELPAYNVLSNENIFVMNTERASHQDIRPLKIGILNLMPIKIQSENQLLRYLSNTPLQVEITLLQTKSYTGNHTPLEHLEKFYRYIDDIKDEKFDGLIITGAPVEQMEFEEVDYWNELCDIMDYAKKNVFSTLYICWGAQAGLYHNYGIKKVQLEKKAFGVIPNHKVTENDPLLRGFDDIFPVPTSRHTTVSRNSILKVKDLTVLAENQENEITLCKSSDNRSIFMMGHLEYDTETLSKEYWRDRNKGLPIEIPLNYFPENNPEQKPYNVWRSTAHLFFSNWLNYYVYQDTPYDLEKI